MDSVCDPNITFSDNGCNHCTRFALLKSERTSTSEKTLSSLVEKIKKRGYGRKYDCIVGVSGGVDSSYVLHWAVKNNLRPLAVHVDNGWNSDLSVSNIEILIRKLNVPLRSVVLDWEKFRECQIAVLNKAIPDGEIPTDHGIYSSIWKIASETKTPTILSGMNFWTESINVPYWSYGHMDGKYVASICDIKSNKQLPFSLLKPFDLFKYSIIKRISSVSILNYIKYDKKTALDTLMSLYEYRPYDGKHFESDYTKFYQAIVLPEQFNIDKRKGHLSDLIYSQQLTREEALRQLSKDIITREDRTHLISLVAEKFSMPKDELYAIIQKPPTSRNSYKSNKKLFNLIKILLQKLRKFGVYPK